MEGNDKGNHQVEECNSIYQNAIFNNKLNSHVNKLIFADLNNNSLRNKFEFLVELVKGKFDILMISETKTGESLPLGQFEINGFNTTFHLDLNSSDGGVMTFIREDITAKLIGSETPAIEGFFVEINLGKQTWLIN